MQISPYSAAVLTAQNTTIENKSNPLNMNGSVSQVSANRDVISTDKASLSSGSALLSRAIGMTDDASPKVGSIATAISNGTYRINEDQLASTLIQTMLQNGESQWKA
jgi:anti-sigma28 factor (negative regulator of flagellin synthesis)